MCIDDKKRFMVQMFHVIPLINLRLRMNIVEAERPRSMNQMQTFAIGLTISGRSQKNSTPTKQS